MSAKKVLIKNQLQDTSNVDAIDSDPDEKIESSGFGEK